MVKELGKVDEIDKSYYTKLVDDAIAEISKHGDFEWFVSNDRLISDDDVPWWKVPCDEEHRDSCQGCPHLSNDIYHIDCDLGYDVPDFFKK